PRIVPELQGESRVPDSALVLTWAGNLRRARPASGFAPALDFWIRSRLSRFVASPCDLLSSVLLFPEKSYGPRPAAIKVVDMSARHFLSLMDCTPQELHSLVRRGIELKDLRERGILFEPLKNRVLGMIFEKAS